MSDVTRILTAIEAGDPAAADQLLPLVYEELRKLAAAKLAREKPGQTLQATALVHEAWLRLVGGAEGSGFGVRGSGEEEPKTEEPKNQKGAGNRGHGTGETGHPHPGTLPEGEGSRQKWNSRGHFFGAAAEAMRRILTDAARRKMAVRHGGEAGREDLPLEAIQADAIADPAETLAVHELL